MYKSPGPPKYLLLSVGEYIKKVWEVDPLSCPKCGNEMKIVSFINEVDVIRKILEHLWSILGYGQARHS
jgi:hypothetical protein